MYHPVFMDCSLRIIFWNARGHNYPAKRSAVRSVVTSARPSLVCLQETKLDDDTPYLVADSLGHEFSSFFHLPADGTRGASFLRGALLRSLSPTPLLGPTSSQPVPPFQALTLTGRSRASTALRTRQTRFPSLSIFVNSVPHKLAHGSSTETLT